MNKRKFAEFVQIYLCLMITCWSILLGPKLGHYEITGSSYLGLAMSNPAIMLIQSNLYTMLTMTVLLVPRCGLPRARFYYDWVFVFPYVMHCSVFFVKNLQDYWLKLHSQPVLEEMNINIEMHVKLLIFSMVQLLALVESVTILYYYLQKKYQLPDAEALN